MNPTRRGLLGMFAAGAAAAIVRPGLLMPVKPVGGYITLDDYVRRVVDPAMTHIAEIVAKENEKLNELPWFGGDIPFRVNPSAGDTLTLNGKTFTFRKDA